MHQQSFEDGANFPLRIAFLKQIELDYQNALFGEHLAGTPPHYINDLRYISSTDPQSLLTRAHSSGTISLAEGRRQPQTPATHPQGHAGTSLD
jgi:hypothetical protein